MKKIIAIAFIGGLVLASCSKKDSTYEQDSNSMLPEPEATVTTDSAKVAPVTETTATATTPAPVATDSATAK